MRRGVIGVWVSGFCAGCLLVEVGLVLVDEQPLSVLIVPALSQGLGIFTALAVGLSSLDRADTHATIDPERHPHIEALVDDESEWCETRFDELRAERDRLRAELAAARGLIPRTPGTGRQALIEQEQTK